MKISFLASHDGRAAKHIIDSIQSGMFEAELGVIITNNKNSEIYQWSTQNGLPIHYISGKTHPDENEKDSAISDVLAVANTELVLLAGYMKKIGPQTLSQYPNRPILPVALLTKSLATLTSPPETIIPCGENSENI